MGLKYFKQVINEFVGNVYFHHSMIKCNNYPYIHLIEITNQCNINCVMCVRDLMTRNKGFMGFDLFKKIIKENYKNMNFVYLQGSGEPTLHTKIFDFIDYANKYNVKTGIHTNGLLLKKDIAKRLFDAGISIIRFSLDSVVKDTYNKIRKGSNFDKVILNIKNTIRLKKDLKSDIIIQIQAIIMDDTREEIKKFKKRWKEEDVEIIIKNKVEWRRSEQYKRKVPCLYGWRSVVVLWNGDVVPCCNDWNGDVVFGNIKNNTLKEIWNNKRYIEFRKKLINGKIDFKPCINCNIMENIKQNKNYPFSKDLLKNIGFAYKSILLMCKRKFCTFFKIY